MKNTLTRAIRFGPTRAVRIRLWPVLIFGFGTLVILVALSGVSAMRRASESYAGISSLYESERRGEQALGRVRSDVQVSAITVRDFLLETSVSPDAARRQMHRLRQSAVAELDTLTGLISTDDKPKLAHLRDDLNAYWQSLDNLFAWSGEPGANRRSLFLKQEVIPRRQAVLGLVSDIEELTYDMLRKRRQDIDTRQQELPYYVGRIVTPVILAGILVAIFSVLRVFEMEKGAERQRQAVESAERELRELSQQLVRTQEEERRSLSRELHDQIGQTLTAVRINVGNLEESLGEQTEKIRQQIDQTKRLSEQALRSIRDLAMGLRPAMLDDLGLGPALEWQARQHSRLCHAPVTLDVEGNLDELSDTHRTCVYRMVQEALNNTAKHARAKHIRIQVTCNSRSVTIAVHDDGSGFDMMKTGSGLGLVGMKERIRQLGGQFMIQSEVGRGTELLAEIPLASRETA